MNLLIEPESQPLLRAALESHLHTCELTLCDLKAKLPLEFETLLRKIEVTKHDISQIQTMLGMIDQEEKNQHRIKCLTAEYKIDESKICARCFEPLQATKFQMEPGEAWFCASCFPVIQQSRETYEVKPGTIEPNSETKPVGNGTTTAAHPIQTAPSRTQTGTARIVQPAASSDRQVNGANRQVAPGVQKNGIEMPKQSEPGNEPEMDGATNEKVTPLSPAAVKIGRTLRDPFSPTDLKARLDGDSTSRAYQWIAAWKGKGWIVTLSFGIYQKTEKFGL